MPVHAGLQRVLAVLLEGIGCHCEYRDLRQLSVFQRPYDPCGLVAIHSRHLYVHQDDIVLPGDGVFYFLHRDNTVFSRVDDRAVKVLKCENVKKSDKLLRFTLDDGSGQERQILSGIAKFYKPEELVGKTLAAIVNLPPRKMMGLDSCGMLISAVHTEKGEEKVQLLMLDDAIPAGSVLC